MCRVTTSEAKKQLVRDVRFVSFGSYTPEKVLTNQDLERMVDTSDEWITTRTGIKERRVAAPEQAASDLALPAARAALARAGIGAEELDAILVGTVTGDHWFPSTACLLQAHLGAKRAFCFDLQAGCSGFLYAAQMGRTLIAAGQAQTILVVGVEILTRITNWTDRNTCVLFGDAAGAAVMRPSDDDRRILSLRLGADGTNAALIEQPAGGSRIPITHEVIEQNLQFTQLRGNEVFKLGVRTMEEVARETLAEAGCSIDDLKILISHQANKRIIDATASRLGVSEDKVFINIQKYGNTSAASVPLAMDEALAEGKVRPGDLVLMVVFGAGLTWGGCLFRW
jgi:3-oxoacyl-[acyl-carrier-protein] synthase-3